MITLDDHAYARLLKPFAQPLRHEPRDYDALLDLIGDTRIVLIGEASHGTHEFYRERALITRRLIAEKGFTAVAVEADWPDALRVNRFVRGADDDGDADEALGGFERFPTWMWRNAEVLDFVGWLRAYNDELGSNAEKTGFYGLDLYSLRASMDAVVDYLERVDPAAARAAKERYACFDHFGPDMESYALAVGAGLNASCEHEVLDELIELQRRRTHYASRDGMGAEDDFFYAEQNARVAKNAEQYYRTMIGAGISSWNLRDSHMVETLERLLAHLDRRRPGTRAVVWAHNSHIGDARATEMTRRHEHNIGELARRMFPQQTVLVGLTTYDGTVTAASDWHGSAQRKRVRPALPSSHEAALHLTGLDRLYIDLRKAGEREPALHAPRLERFIGVIYLPETERQSHYYQASLATQFDALLHFDHTRAVEPLERTPHWELPEVPETFPTGV
jgi:erythromycin esterase-like protein